MATDRNRNREPADKTLVDGAYRRITIKDMARKLGISKSTVSRALRDHPNVKPETRRAVLELAEEWDYSPDTVALSMVHRKTFTLGLVIPNISFPYFSYTISGAQEIASKAGYNVVICQSNESLETEQSVIRTLVSSRVDGLLVSISIETDRYEHIHALRKKGIPVVLFDRVVEKTPIPRVMMDNFQGAYMGTEHLIEGGYRRIAHISGPECLLVCQERIRGFHAAHAAHGVTADPELIVSAGFRMTDGETATEKLMQMEERPDAILAVSDSAAIGAKMKVEAMGYRVPEDVAIVGFNDEPIAKVVRPGLTSVALPMYDLGKTATRLLLKQITYPDQVSQIESIRLKPSLVVRDSSASKKR